MTDSTSRDDPLHRLSLETQAAILSYLPSSDLLECTLVSRGWQERIVNLGQIRWQCRIQPYRVTRRPFRRPPFDEILLIIPYYAKQLECIHFRYYNDTEKICVLLRALREKGCNKIRQLTFSDCRINDPTRFIDALRGCVAENLHSFAITSTKTTLMPLSILAICPRLRVLYYQPGVSRAAGMNDEESTALSDDVKFEQLMCVSIHGVINESQLQGILSRSPNLRCIRLCTAPLKNDDDLNDYGDYGDYGDDNHIYSDAAWPGLPELRAIRDQCQRIEHIELNRTRYVGKINIDKSSEYDEMPWWKKYTEMDPAELPFSGLQVFKYIENEYSDTHPCDEEIIASEIFKLLQVNQHTLKTFHLGNTSLNVSSLGHEGRDIQPERCNISDLSFPNLRDLAIIGDVHLWEDQLCQLLSKSPDLESLEISVTVDGILDQNLPNVVTSLKALESLSFKMPNWYDMEGDGCYAQADSNFTDEKRSISRVLLALAASNDCRLESLCLGGQICGDMASVNGIGLTDLLLDAVAKVPSLRKVQLHHDDLYQAEFPFREQEERGELSDMELTKTGLKSFAKAIKNSRIEELWLAGIEDIPGQIFGSIGSAASLRRLHAAPDLQIDGRKLPSLFGRPDRPRYTGKLTMHDQFHGVRFSKTIGKYADKVEFCDKECCYTRRRARSW